MDMVAIYNKKDGVRSPSVRNLVEGALLSFGLLARDAHKEHVLALFHGLGLDLEAFQILWRKQKGETPSISVTKEFFHIPGGFGMDMQGLYMRGPDVVEESIIPMTLANGSWVAKLTVALRHGARVPYIVRFSAPSAKLADWRVAIYGTTLEGKIEDSGDLRTRSWVTTKDGCSIAYEGRFVDASVLIWSDSPPSGYIGSLRVTYVNRHFSYVAAPAEIFGPPYARLRSGDGQSGHVETSMD